MSNNFEKRSDALSSRETRVLESLLMTKKTLTRKFMHLQNARRFLEQVEASKSTDQPKCLDSYQEEENHTSEAKSKTISKNVATRAPILKLIIKNEVPTFSFLCPFLSYLPATWKPIQFDDNYKKRPSTQIFFQQNINQGEGGVVPAEERFNGETITRCPISSCWILILLTTSYRCAGVAPALKSEKLCSQCTRCSTKSCHLGEAFLHTTAWDNTLIAGALQYDYVEAQDGGVYSVPNIVGGTSAEYNAYFGWQSTSGSASGYHR